MKERNWSVTPGDTPGFIEVRGASFRIPIVLDAYDISDVQRWEREDDARLIAAAPELLAAARMVVILKRVGGVLPGVKEMIDAVIEDAEKAIRKAEGGE